MKVKDLTAIGGETIYKVVDASLTGFFTHPHYLHFGADKNVIGKEYGELELVAVEASGKNTMTIYVK